MILVQALDFCFLFDFRALQGKLANVIQVKAPVNVVVTLCFPLLFEMLPLQVLGDGFKQLLFCILLRFVVVLSGEG